MRTEFVNGFQAVVLGAILGVALLGAGCVLGKSGGEILVGQPEVFTRQRLVNRRLTEQQWLDAQLGNTSHVTTFQGSRDVRIFSGLYNRTNASFDPQLGHLVTMQNQLSIQSAQNQLERNALQHQIDMTTLQQQLRAVQGGNASVSQPPGSNMSTSATFPAMTASPSSSPFKNENLPTLPSANQSTMSQAQLTSIEVLRDQLAWRNAVQAALREQELDDAHDLLGLALYTLKLDISVLPWGPGNDSFAKVEFDLKGAARYGFGTCEALWKAYYPWFWRLRSDIHLEAIALQQRLESGLLSQEEKVRLASAASANKSVALVRALTLAEPIRAQQPKDSLNEARRQAAALVGSKYRNSLDNLIVVKDPFEIGLDDRRYYVPDIPDIQGPAGESTSKISPCGASVIAIASAVSGTSIINTSTAHNLRSGDGVLITAGNNTSSVSAWIVTRVSPTAFSLDGSSATGAYAGGSFKPIPGQLAAFWRRTIELPPLRVFTADPKEEAQNISDVAAVEQLRNIVLSLQAVLPQYGVSAANYTEYINRSQTFLHGILRRPLLVAYADQGTKFGWILGPRFEIGDKGKVRFSHTAVQRSVQVSIVAPGWLRDLSVPYKAFWVDRTGDSRQVGEGEIPITLPSDVSAITTRFMQESGERRAPFIEPSYDVEGKRTIVRLQSQKAGDLLIRGQNLWRNPKVFVGSQSASRVEVLPDMSGVTAHFESVAMPPGRAGELGLLDLSVVTSEGIATLARAVQILPEATAPADPFVVSLQSPRVVGAAGQAKGVPLTFSAPLGSVPGHFHRFAVDVRPLLPGEDPARVRRQFLQLVSDVTVTVQGRTLFLEAPVSLPPITDWPRDWINDFGIGSARGAPVERGWLLQSRPQLVGAEGGSLMTVATAGGTPSLFAFFPTEAAAYGTLLVKDAPTPRAGAQPETSFNTSNSFATPLVALLGGGDVFLHAYPGLDKALQEGLGLRIAEVKGGAEVGSTMTRLTTAEFEASQEVPLSPAPLDRLIARRFVTIKSLPAPTSADRSATWLRERLGDTQPHEFRLLLVVSPAVQIPLDPPITLRLAEP